MKGTQINLTERLLDELDEEAGEKGISRSELIRRILDQYFD